jgi:hypothetical protein
LWVDRIQELRRVIRQPAAIRDADRKLDVWGNHAKKQ